MNARNWYEKAAAQGNTGAQYNLGVLYDEGKGVTQDYGQARAWYEKAAALDFAPAQYNLGVLYNKGKGVTQDYGQARAWFEKAAAPKDNKEVQQIAQQALQELDIADSQKPWRPDPAAQERERIREAIQRLVEGKGGTP